MKVSRFISGMRWGLGFVLLCGCGASSVGVSPNGGKTANTRPSAGRKTFHYTDGEQSFIVPTGVTKISVITYGAGGGGFGFRSGGRGGRVHAVIPVTPGETLYIFVGGTTSGSAGGFNGGGPGGTGGYHANGYGGGGASDVREGGDQLSDRVVVAGGGGGQGGFNDYRLGRGGQGGGKIGGAGGVGQGTYYTPKCYYGGLSRPDSYFGDYGGCGGGGGTQEAGGAGGGGGLGPFCYGVPGNAGSLGQGGTGAADDSYECGGFGGGGGGGYYGGGGGGEGSNYGSSPTGGGGGGGGGSSFVEPNALKYHDWRGWRDATGNGIVVFSWQ